MAYCNGGCISVLFSPAPPRQKTRTKTSILKESPQRSSKTTGGMIQLAPVHNRPYVSILL